MHVMVHRTLCEYPLHAAEVKTLYTCEVASNVSDADVAEEV